ncbi:anthranilate synthase component II [Staphylococcus lutrae]|uniref:Glutamine amidotransferase n=1 Tax=Staphylococcus lutrae TaxID=155085 RepID=A0AAC9WIS1_9STAP|nr:aminodeoxychorismate/anthranilate synthase component II [Staphylococcus lutrae]ARJ50594.1 glutamine amidotransferase [Staphylococcus lutrae]PNZ37522.1 glutamine amidotransferase [Staphylococcus lutrae]
MILVIDNYDSFTYNLVDMFRQRTHVIVKYPDDETLFDIQPTAVVISPGPGHPEDTTRLHEIIDHFKSLPILGICLGAQALYCYYGGMVIVADKVMHGKIDVLQFGEPTPLYAGISEHSEIMRYHSLICDRHSLPNDLKITGRTTDSIQSFEHKKHPHYGIQYHPESFASQDVASVIDNFLIIVKKGVLKHDTTQ